MCVMIVSLCSVKIDMLSVRLEPVISALVSFSYKICCKNLKQHFIQATGVGMMAVLLFLILIHTIYD